MGQSGHREGWIAVVDDPSFPLFTGVLPLLRFPPVCVPHGAPAVEYSESVHHFSYSALHDDLLEHTIGNYFFRTRAPRKSQPFSTSHREWPDARLRCAWPLCAQCSHRYRRFVIARQVAYWMAIASVAQLGVLVLFFSNAPEVAAVISVGVLVVGGAVSAAATMGFARRAVNVGTLRITADYNLAVVTAHPNFVDALDAIHQRYVAEHGSHAP